MSGLTWFLYGLAAATIAALMFGIFKKKFISLHEGMIVIGCFVFGPVTFYLAVTAVIIRAMIEVESKPYNVLLDWRPKEHDVECPRCGYNDSVSISITFCPKCEERLSER